MCVFLLTITTIVPGIAWIFYTTGFTNEAKRQWIARFFIPLCPLEGVNCNQYKQYIVLSFVKLEWI